SGKSARKLLPVRLSVLKSPGIHCAKTATFVSDFRLIWPVQPRGEKYSASVFRKFMVEWPRLAPDREGRFAIVTDVGSGMRWTRAHQLTSDVASGRQRRVVLIPRCWNQVLRDGSQGDGGNQARSPGRARYKPQTIAQRMRIDLASLWLLACASAFFF